MWLACGYKSYNYKIWDQIWLNFKLLILPHKGKDM